MKTYKEFLNEARELPVHAFNIGAQDGYIDGSDGVYSFKTGADRTKGIKILKKDHGISEVSTWKEQQGVMNPFRLSFKMK